MPQLFTFLDGSTDIASLRGSGIVVKNKSIGPVDIDSNGTLLYPNQLLMCSSGSAVIEKALKSGKLETIKTFAQEKTPQKKEEVPQTVAQSDYQTSVQ